MSLVRASAPGQPLRAVISLRTTHAFRTQVPAATLHIGGALLIVCIAWASGVVSGFVWVHALIAFLAVGYALVAWLFCDAIVFFLSFSLFATLAPMVASDFYIELGNRISEQGIVGFPTGATVRLSFYVLVYFIAGYSALRFGLNHIPKRIVDSRISAFARIARALHGTALVGGIGLLLIYGSPLLQQQDRFEYWATVPEIFSRYPFLLAILSFLTVCAVAVSPTRAARWWTVSLLASSAIILLLFSEKFTGLFSIFLFSVTAWYVASIYHRGSPVKPLRLLGLCSAVGVVLLGFAAGGYMVFYGYTTQTVWAKLADRALALHGHVWFGMDRAVQSGASNGPLSALFPAPGAGGLTGIQQMMYLVAPDDFVDRMIDQGVRFANVGFPLPVWVLGYGWAALYFVVAGVLTGAVLTYLLWGVARLRPISIVLALNMFRQITNAFLVGDVSDLYKPLMLATVLLVLADLAYAFIRRRLKRRTESA